MTSRSLMVAIVAGAIAATPAARAADKWEGGFTGDDGSLTNHTLSHGAIEEHDLDQEGGLAEDQDWMHVPTIARHSYEARLYGTNDLFSFGPCPATCAQFERVDSSGTILTEDAGFAGFGNYHRRIVWTATTTGVDDYIRVTGAGFRTEDATDVYTIRFWDTTYGIPRWNNSGGQVTVFLIQNLTPIAVTGKIDFYTSGGTLLTSQPFTIGANSLFSFNTSTLGILAGQAGHAYVSHDAGYGGLAGKAVALEPSTGFSFDTLMVPIPD